MEQKTIQTSFYDGIFVFENTFKESIITQNNQFQGFRYHELMCNN